MYIPGREGGREERGRMEGGRRKGGMRGERNKNAQEMIIGVVILWDCQLLNI